MKKYKIKDVIAKNGNLWVRCHNTKEAAKIVSRYSDVSFSSWPIIVYNRSGDVHNNLGIGFNYCYDGVGNSYGDPIIEFNEIEFEFVLPEKWFIERNEDNYSKINGWFNDMSVHGRDSYFSDKLCVCYPEMRLINYPRKTLIEQGYKEITFEQFLKYVLKQENMKKEIIGWKFKPGFEKYEQAVRGILLSDKVWWDKYANSNLIGKGWLFTEGIGGIKSIIEDAGVLNLWFEPVYKGELKIGDCFKYIHYGKTDYIEITSFTDDKKIAICKYIGSKEIGKFDCTNDLIDGCRQYHPDQMITPCTKEEAEANKRIEIAGYRAEARNGGVKFGCQEFSLQDIRSYKQLFVNEVGAKLTIHGEDITLEMLNKLETLANDK